MAKTSEKAKAIESYLARDKIGRSTWKYTIDIDKYANEVKKLYEDTYNKIFAMLDDYHTAIDYPTYARISQLLKQIGSELDALNGKADKYLKKAMKQISEYATKTAIEDISIFDKITKKESWHYENNYNYIQQMVADNYRHIAEQTDKMRFDLKMALQQEATKVFRRASVEGLTRKEAYKALKDELIKKPEFKFVDKKGRKWDTSTYLEMLTRTVIAEGMRQAYINTLVNEGHDLVKVSTHGAKDECSRWEGKILSLTGYIKDYPTYDDAKATGEIFHPRCRHRLLAYHPRIEEVVEHYEKSKSAGDEIKLTDNNFKLNNELLAPQDPDGIHLKGAQASFEKFTGLIKETLNGLDPNAKRLLAKFINNDPTFAFEYHANTRRKGSHYNKVDNKIVFMESPYYYSPQLLDKYIEDGSAEEFKKRFKETLMHELGHYLDKKMGELVKSSKGSFLSERQKDFYDDFFYYAERYEAAISIYAAKSLFQTENEIEKNKRFWDKVQFEFASISKGTSETGGLDDVISALTIHRMDNLTPIERANNVSKTMYGHSRLYWTEFQGNRLVEVFANMFEMEMNNKTEQLQFIKKHFPEIHKTFYELYDLLLLL